jgi:hypothetical protein
LNIHFHVRINNHSIHYNVRYFVSQLRVILEGVSAKQQERVWLKNKTTGELDDKRLVEGLTGERTIYRHRGQRDPEPGSQQEKPKR